MTTTIEKISRDDRSYRTPDCRPSWFSAAFPSFSFYCSFLDIVRRAGSRAKKNRYDTTEWWASSMEVLRSLERVGITISVEGLEHLSAEDGPVVFIGNHLSVMETVVLPALILPYLNITYVIKQSLLEVPVFKHVMSSCNPIAVSRTNPRQDLKLVIDEGGKRLENGISVIIFPQTTRAAFNPEQFSSIGVKLAKKAGVPIIPIALITDAWGNGRWLKDFGWIKPARRVRFRFGQPMMVNGKGNEEHQSVIDFVEQNLARWKEQDKAR